MSVTTSKHARDPFDFYVEPAWCVELLLDNEVFIGASLDPACGLNTIPNVMLKRGLFCARSDIDPRSDTYQSCDFTDTDAGNWSETDNIICNPPFSAAVPFIHRALAIATNKVAMLLPLTFLASQERKRTIFEPHPPTRVYVLSRRPSMPPGQMFLDNPDYKAKGGSVDFCWIVWDTGAKGPVQLEWLA